MKVLAFDIEVTEVMEISGASAEEFLTQGFFRNGRHKTVNNWLVVWNMTFIYFYDFP